MIDPAKFQPGSVTVLIGENGSGKSLELRRLCLRYLTHQRPVLAVAPSVFDRFRGIRSQWNFSFYGGRQGRVAARNFMQKTLQVVSRGKLEVLRQITRALAYTRFDPVIGIKLSGPHENIFRHAEFKNYPDDEQLVSMIRRWENEKDRDGIVYLQLERHSVSEISSASFAVLTNYEKRLRDRGLKLEYLLFRNGAPIPLTEACSGEIIFITSICFLAAKIRTGSVILIDEPETSLHPTWQKRYIETLLDLFTYYEPQIIISTHSPIIISGSAAATDETRHRLQVYEMREQQSAPFAFAGMGLEEMYDQLFGLITPRNHYLSQRAVVILNELGERKRDLGGATEELRSLQARSYDPEQAAAFDQVIAMAGKIDDLTKKDRR